MIAALFVEIDGCYFGLPGCYFAVYSAFSSYVTQDPAAAKQYQAEHRARRREIAKKPAEWRAENPGRNATTVIRHERRHGFTRSALTSQNWNGTRGEQRLPQWMIDRYGYAKARRIGVVSHDRWERQNRHPKPNACRV